MKKVIDQKLLEHYLSFSTYTYPGLYEKILKSDLPTDIRAIGDLVRRQLIHRTTLEWGNVGTNADQKFGDMTKVQWWRQPEDDVLITAAAILAELYRRDKRGFIKERKEEDKLILTCRYVTILIASILKSKGIPCRVRAGHAPYLNMGTLGNVSTDHWINQYWNVKEKRWVTIDVDGSWSLHDRFDPYDLPKRKFDFPADAWLNVRAGKDKASRFWNSGGTGGQVVLLWSLFYDFHCLMNNEVPYIHVPEIAFEKNFQKLSETELKEIDDLARLMQNPDEKFPMLKKIWETNKKFRLLKGGLL